jgi:ABC-type nitrate/sulfonate/bicarbonate transport system permease component
MKRWRLPTLGVVILLSVSELVSRLHILPPHEYPPVSTIAQVLFQELQGAAFWNSTFQTVKGWALGLALATAVAVPLGVVLGASDLVFRSLRVVIEGLRPIPTVALIPLAILLFGIGLGTKVFLIFLAAFWPILIQMIYGVRDVDPVALECVRSYGLGRAARVRYLILPSAAPFLMTGLRIAASVALIVGVATELVIGAPGLGAAINAAQIGGAQPLQYAYIVATGILGWGLNAIFSKLERRALHWHQSQRAPGNA